MNKHLWVGMWLYKLETYITSPYAVATGVSDAYTTHGEREEQYQDLKKSVGLSSILAQIILPLFALSRGATGCAGRVHEPCTLVA